MGLKIFSTKFFVLNTVKEPNENHFLRSSKRKLDRRTNKETVHCEVKIKIKALRVTSIKKMFYNCFDFAVKIRRDALGPVEDASGATSFPFSRNFWHPMQR